MSDSATETAKQVLVAIDMAQMEEFNEPEEVDLSANAFARELPAPEGRYIALLTMPEKEDRAKNFIRQGMTKGAPEKGFPPRVFHRFNFDATIQSDLDGNVEALAGKRKRFEEEASNLVNTKNGKHVSELGTILGALGVESTGTVTKAEMAATFRDYLSSGQAKLGVTIQWQGTTKVKNALTGKDEWHTLYGQETFRNPETKELGAVTLNGNTYNPKAVITSFFKLA